RRSRTSERQTSPAARVESAWLGILPGALSVGGGVSRGKVATSAGSARRSSSAGAQPQLRVPMSSGRLRANPASLKGFQVTTGAGRPRRRRGDQLLKRCSCSVEVLRKRQRAGRGRTLGGDGRGGRAAPRRHPAGKLQAKEQEGTEDRRIKQRR